jgi:hypothetical protein
VQSVFSQHLKKVREWVTGKKIKWKEAKKIKGEVITEVKVIRLLSNTEEIFTPSCSQAGVAT